MPRNKKSPERSFAPDQVVALLDVSSAFFGIILHDLSSHAGLLNDSLGALGQRLSAVTDKPKSGNHRKGSQSAMSKDDDLQTALRASSALSRTVSLLRPYVQRTAHRTLATRPTDIVSTLRTSLPGIEIAVDEDSPKSLSIDYPANVLTGILSQVLYSRSQTVQQRRKVLLRWYMHGTTFVCEIHDDRLNFRTVPSGTLMVLDGLTEYLKKNPADAQSLSLLNRIVTACGGTLLFSQSTILRGALTYLRLPVQDFTRR